MKLNEYYKDVPFPYPMRLAEVILRNNPSNQIKKYDEVVDKPRFLYYKSPYPLVNVFKTIRKHKDL